MATPNRLSHSGAAVRGVPSIAARARIAPAATISRQAPAIAQVLNLLRCIDFRFDPLLPIRSENQSRRTPRDRLCIIIF